MSEAMTAREVAAAQTEIVIGIGNCVERLAKVRTFLTHEQSMFLAEELRSAADQLDAGAVHGARARVRIGRIRSGS
jgi:hypothetical protein